MPIQSQRPVDKMAKESLSWMERSFVLINKSKIKSWQTVLILGFVAGFLAAIIWAVSYDVQPRTSAALKNNLIAVPPANDFEIFKSCWLKPATGNCLKSDFDKDGVIGVSDFNLMRSALQYDLNGDNVLNLSNNKYYPSDIQIFKSCWLKPATGNCLKSDFDKNGAVGISDFGLMKSALQYDLNGDRIVNLSVNQKYASDFDFWLFCFNDNNALGVAGDCIKADFNYDGYVTPLDYGKLLNTVRVYDLNGDGVVNIGNNQIYSSDYGDFIKCFNQIATSTCAKADFNGDGFVGGPDHTLLIGSMAYDINGDGAVSMQALNNGVASEQVNSDFDIFQSCYRQLPTGDCAKADFNSDGNINTTDLTLLKISLQYDLNGDNVINLSNNNTFYPFDMEIFQSCFGQPATGNCLKSDFDKNGVVGISDFGLMKSALQYDLNGDSMVDLNP